MGTGADPGRGELVHRAFRLELLTAGWMGIEAVVSIGSGIVAGSLSLIAFGADSVIELASALVLLWRLRIELEQGAEFSAIIERRAGRIAGALLFVLAAYIIASAAVGLWERRGQEFSLLGLAVTLLAIPMMVALSKAKIRIAEQIGSRALRADAFEAIACSYLAVIVVAGLIAQWLFGAWWIDSVTSLAIVGFLIKEGREAWFDEDAGDEVGR
jgi:divalent metal cation (Fe/Co/Zn/Cd) transporter